MLFYLSLYLLAAIFVFQGTQLLGELRTPMGVVPAEVVPRPTQIGRAHV